MKKNKKINEKNQLKLQIYFWVTTISFLFMILINNAHLSVSIFFLIQIISVLFILPSNKGKLLLIPIFIISLNFFLRDNVWYFSNYVIIWMLYITMILVMTKSLDIDNGLFGFFKKIFSYLLYPLNNASYLKFSKENEVDNKKKKTTERVLKGLLISLPFMIILLVMLSSADMIFSKTIGHFFQNILDYINLTFIFKIGYSILAGLYFFGLIYSYYKPKVKDTALENWEEERKKNIKEKDTFVFNIVLGMILVIYTIFIFIQFRYLFAKGTLPFNLSYAEYARNGFFELLFLTALNIGLIIFNMYYNKDKKDNSSILNKGLLYYLCTITIILLISSFYRMNLYSIDFGLTRLRLYVFGFLIFEAIALLITYYYIYKPKFNIIFVYTIIGLVYYLTLSIVPTDRIIAKNQIDRYLKDPEVDISYVMDLSLDAAPEIARLVDDDYYSYHTRYYFEEYFQYKDNNEIRQFSLSYYNAQKIYNDLKEKWEK